jgi:hypothetical protein
MLPRGRDVDEVRTFAPLPSENLGRLATYGAYALDGFRTAPGRAPTTAAAFTGMLVLLLLLLLP